MCTEIHCTECKQYQYTEFCRAHTNDICVSARLRVDLGVCVACKHKEKAWLDASRVQAADRALIDFVLIRAPKAFPSSVQGVYQVSQFVESDWERNDYVARAALTFSGHDGSERILFTTDCFMSYSRAIVDLAIAFGHPTKPPLRGR